jgi:hypothetical protein
MPRRQIHWLYNAYLALAAANGPYGLNLSESQARDTIKGWFPNFAPYVNDIIDASGDLARIPEHTLTQSAQIIQEEEMSRAGEDMNKALRDRVSGRFAAKTKGQNDGQDDTQGDDMNAKLRQRQSRIPSDTGEAGMNDALRRAAGRE